MIKANADQKGTVKAWEHRLQLGKRGSSSFPAPKPPAPSLERCAGEAAAPRVLSEPVIKRSASQPASAGALSPDTGKIYHELQAQTTQREI